MRTIVEFLKQHGPIRYRPERRQALREYSDRMRLSEFGSPPWIGEEVKSCKGECCELYDGDGPDQKLRLEALPWKGKYRVHWRLDRACHAFEVDTEAEALVLVKDLLEGDPVQLVEADRARAAEKYRQEVLAEIRPYLPNLDASTKSRLEEFLDGVKLEDAPYPVLDLVLRGFRERRISKPSLHFSPMLPILAVSGLSLPPIWVLVIGFAMMAWWICRGLWAMNTTPYFAKTPDLTLSEIVTANTARDGTGTIVDGPTGPTDNAWVTGARMIATVTTTAGNVKVFVKKSGGAYELFDEVSVTAVTVSASVIPWSSPWIPPAPDGLLAQEVSDLIGYAPHAAEAMNVWTSTQGLAA